MIVAGEAFQLDEVWRSPKGTFYRVVEAVPGSRQVALRAGIHGTGKKRYRTWDRVEGWTRLNEEALQAQVLPPGPPSGVA